MKILLAGSGGGHVRQLLDLEPAWRDQDYAFVTEDTALGRSLADHHPVKFVEHYALGQARLGRGGKMLRAGVRNFVQSVRIVAQERPDIVITTGAGAVYWAAVASKLSGARIILIDSFARFDKPSKFARLLKPLADDLIVQSTALKQHWPKAKLFDPLKVLDTLAPPKEDLLFATVGATLRFPRLVEAVLALKASGRLPERVILQVGENGLTDSAVPEGVEIYETLKFERIQELLQSARFVVCHGGTGSIITALRAGCGTVAIPRRFSRAEHYDDHQEEITDAFRARGLIEVADDADQLFASLERLRAKPAVMATTDPQALIGFLKERLGAARPS